MAREELNAWRRFDQLLRQLDTDFAAIVEERDVLAETSERQSMVVRTERERASALSEELADKQTDIKSILVEIDRRVSDLPLQDGKGVDGYVVPIDAVKAVIRSVRADLGLA